LDLGENQQHTPQGNHHIRRLDFHQQDEQQFRPPEQTSTIAKPVETPSVPKPQTQLSNESSPEKKPPPLDPTHARSFSGHQSIGTMGTEVSEVGSVFDDSDVGKYVLKRIEAANEELKSLEMDQMMPFKEEGHFEPLGSIGSLYDILREGDDNFELLQRPVSIASRPPLKPKPQHSSHSNKPNKPPRFHQTPNGIQSTGPSASQTTAIEKQVEQTSKDPVTGEIISLHHAKSNRAPPQRATEQPKKTHDKRRRNRGVPAVGSGESLMDKFQKMSTSPPHVGEDGGNFV
jgi:hypothetical protein